MTWRRAESGQQKGDNPQTGAHSDGAQRRNVKRTLPGNTSPLATAAVPLMLSVPYRGKPITLTMRTSVARQDCRISAHFV